jgi:hypothetical protein
MRAKLSKSLHEKADPCQEFVCSFRDFSHFFPFSHAASVATLPSALVVERIFARCQLGVLDSSSASLFTREGWART